MGKVRDRKNGGCQGLGVGRNWGLLFSGNRDSEDKKVLEMEGTDDCTSL